MRIPRPVAFFVLLVIVSIVPAYRAVESLPAQLTDAAYWQLVTNSSEPDGAFFSENFLSNERGFQYVIPTLLQRVQPGGVYIGVGPEQNFTYIAALHPKMAFVIDIRRQNMLEHLLYKALFEMAPSRVEFLSRLFSRKLPAAPAPGANIRELFEAYTAVEANEALYAANLRDVRDLLLKKHGFELSAGDLTTLEHVYSEFSRQGTSIGYSVSDALLMGEINTRAREGRTSNATVSLPPVTPAFPDAGEILRILNSSANPSLSQLLSAAPVAPSSFPNYAELMTATDDAGRNWSYLANDENYQTVREMQIQNRIVPLVGDFAGPVAIRAVGEYLKGHDAKLTTFYLSNVEQYLNPAEMKRFYGNVAAVPLDASSSFIRSAQGTGPQPGIAQTYTSPIQAVIDAVMEGRVQSYADIIRIWH